MFAFQREREAEEQPKKARAWIQMGIASWVQLSIPEHPREHQKILSLSLTHTRTDLKDNNFLF